MKLINKIKMAKNTIHLSLFGLFICFFLSVPLINLMFISKNEAKIEKNGTELNNIKIQLKEVIQKLSTTQSSFATTQPIFVKE